MQICIILLYPYFLSGIIRLDINKPADVPGSSVIFLLVITKEATISKYCRNILILDQFEAGHKRGLGLRLSLSGLGGK